MSKGAQSGQEGSEMSWFYVIALIAIILLGTYYLFHDSVVSLMFSIKQFELRLIGYFTTRYEGVSQWAVHTALGEISLKDIRDLSFVIGNALLYPFLLLSSVLVLLLWFCYPKTKFQKTLDMKSLRASLENQLPYYNALHYLEDNKKTPQKWSMALSPEAFAKHHGLLCEDDQGKVLWDGQKAHTVMVDQLGELWPGLEKLAVHQQIIFAILSAFALYAREEAESVLYEISRKIKEDRKIDFNQYRYLIEKYAKDQKIMTLIAGNAYTYTVFTSLLIHARKTGIVTTSTFLWLKYIDRRLWYVLNNVGRQSVFCEAAAVRAHWLVERDVNRAIKTPMIDEAIVGLKDSLGV
ncbi:type IVB secretion system coupling complex protein DotM/IcmP [Facilibium subflavum]|uniref:type IVB secretion system coupling complex protein DotM/IcmP n=1 Tax=Facilibium subflavum TaxID=2219058 RepID=UPI000E65DE87|nr:type IVB secretion system coupling complex protein DotM/IcmP [Facilibium subflavum]